MSKIAFFCIPAHGHTNPTLEVVRELTGRGNEVRYYSFAMMKDKIEAAGAEFIACDQYDIHMEAKPEDAEKVVTDIAFSTELIVNTTLALEEAIAEDMRAWKPDCIVADSMAFWGKLTALKMGIPFISSTTTFAFNRYSAQVMPKKKGGLFPLLFSMCKAQKSIKELRKKGYPVKNVFDIIANNNDTNTIVYTSPEFQPYADTFSDKYTFVGPSVPNMEPAARTRNRPLIYISLGTVLNDKAGFYQNCMAALKDSDMDVIMSVGDLVEMESPGNIPDNFQVERNVNQIEVLQQTDAFITHCGMNSINEALYYHVPLLLFPQTAEQQGVAYRVKELGAGIYLEEDSTASIRTAIKEILDNAVYKEKAAMIADSFRRCGGAKLAADKILEMTGNQ